MGSVEVLFFFSQDFCLLFFFSDQKIHDRPDRYVPLFGEYTYDFSKWRPSVPFVEQLKAFQELIDEGKVTYGFLLTSILASQAT